MAALPLPDPDAYEAVKRLGRSALAWEVLRRDPAYQTAFRQWRSQSDRWSGAADPAFAALWGLHFP